MAVESNFSFLFQNLKLDDPWLPPKPWESIPTESGVSHSNQTSTINSLQEPIYDPTTVSEVNLVRLIINSLEGVESSLLSIEKLSESFCTSPADRTEHRIPSLWYRSSSTNALGKILKSVGRSGFVAFLLRKFVDYYRFMNSNLDRRTREEGTSGSEVDNEYSFVNQAFSVAVGKVLEGYICALDRLYASVQMRRSVKKGDESSHISSGIGCLTSVTHSEITTLEVYLHTKELRTHIEAVGNICLLKHVDLAFSTSSLEDLTFEATKEFSSFPRGADLLTYLYMQLRDADPVHHALLKFLFVRSCEPYFGFIRSWIYQAKINDPHKEFIVEYVDDSMLYLHARDGSPSASVKERNGVSVPCFLRSLSLPLLRAGQQLQVFIKLLELCRWMCPGDQTYKDILPCLSGASNDYIYNLPPLTFDKRSLEDLVVLRENKHQIMQKRLQISFTKLDIRHQQMSCNVIPSGCVPIFVDNRRCTTDIPGLFTLDDNLQSPSSTADTVDLILGTAKLDSDASSSMDGFFYEADPWESSECSSSSSTSELNESEEPTVPHEHSIEMEVKSLSASGLLAKFYKDGDIMPKPSESENSHAVGCIEFGYMDSICHFVDCHDKETKLNICAEHFQLGDGARIGSSETLYADYQSIVCWPLGGLVKNPFYLDGVHNGEIQSQSASCSLKASDKGSDLCPSENSSLDHTRGDMPLEDCRASFDSLISPSWDLKYNCDLFSKNPMLTTYAWSHKMDGARGTSCMGSTQSSIPFFSFSSVKDPSKAFEERFLSSRTQGLQGELPLAKDCVVRMDENIRGLRHHGDYLVVDKKDSALTCSELTFSEKQHEKNVPKSASGGAKWENTLSYCGNSVMHAGGGQSHSSGSVSDIPVDVVVKKCILQEILLQYKYVSSFTIKLLEEAFDLREHFLALRRYHFMEFADWADLFILSLWDHKWYAVEGNKRISEIQEFLDMAVQRSSCEADPYKERLYLYTKGDAIMPISTSNFGIHAFDFIALGYRVDWPVSIVLTQGALKIYAEIFSFLIRVKLAVFSLTDVWRLLKDLMHFVNPREDSEFDEQNKKYFNLLMKMRFQVNHFVSTLQQYVLSQLSHASWSRFLNSLRHEVKDMLDIESAHMAYLADSLHICFLSDGTQTVAGVIENILQSALDFRSCFTLGGCDDRSDQRDSSRLLDRLNFSQVLTIKDTFKKNLKELNLCYLKSPKHRKYGLCHFWEYLNYNDYYTNVFGDAINVYTF